MRAEAEPLGDGVRLRLFAVPRRIVARVTLSGGKLDAAETLRAIDLEPGDEIVADDVEAVAERVRSHYARNGYPTALVRADAIETDERLEVVVAVHIDPGPPERLFARRFFVTPDPDVPGLAGLVARYRIRDRARIVEREIDSADEDLEKRLRAAGWHRAEISHEVVMTSAGRNLHVYVRAGPLVQFVFEGNETFDASQLAPALQLESAEDRSPEALADRVRDYYWRHGFLDAEVVPSVRGGPDDSIHDLVLSVREKAPVRVHAREYPCLTGTRSAEDVGSEIDSFLSEQLPGTGLFTSVEPRMIDATYGPLHPTGARVSPHSFNPWKTYVPEVYERAMKHVQELYRSEGYLSATVGPATLVRRQCQLRSPPGQCIPVGPPLRPATACSYDSETSEPLPEPAPDPRLACTPDSQRGVRCEPDVTLVIPVKLGAQTELYDVRFEGNQRFTGAQLLRESKVELGAPVSLTAVEKSRRRLLDLYAELGYVYANVEADLELSPDHTRARITFVITESEQVRVSDVVMRGAKRTNERLIRKRVALARGEPYKRSLVRRTEERIALLGVFSDVSVGLESPEVPAREKVVIVTVREQTPQYVEAAGGMSSGDGVRGALGYGYVNLGGEAIQLRTAFHLSYLPDFFIAEPEVRARFSELELVERLERNNTISVEFPEIGLGPLFRLGVEGLDVHDNSRDFGLTRQAGLLTLIYRPTRRISAGLGPALEVNDAKIWGAEESENALDDYVRNHRNRANLFRVPQDRTIAFAQQLTATWDRRDNPLNATKGTYVSARVEHVRAVPDRDVGTLLDLGKPGDVDPDATIFTAITSEFFRLTARVAGYVPFNARGLSLGVSVGWGANLQAFSESATYPDRLFFLGGADSMRGFFQASLIPEDIAQEVLAGRVELDDVVIRGGDFFINPRAELRIPIGKGQVQTTLFVDSGNLWADATSLSAADVLDPRKLRYSTGTGVRVATPIGPLVFDYGLNLDRLADRVLGERERQRYWEDLGAFHFSIGLF